MSFDISNDADFLQDIQNSNIDDASIDADSLISNIQEEKAEESKSQSQEISKDDINNDNNKNLKPKKHHKHKNQTQNSTKKKPILDLSAFDFGAIDDNTEKNSIQEPTQKNLPGIEIVNIQSSALESRVSNYLDKSLSSLKSDILNEIDFIFNQRNTIRSLIDTFLLNILSEIRNEINFLRTMPIQNQPINISIEIDLPKKKPIFYKELSADSILNQISYLKSQFSQTIPSIKMDISSEIKYRETLISKILNEEKLLSTKLHNLQDKSFSLKSKFNDIEHSIRSISIKNFDLNEKIKDLEEKSYIESIKNDNLNEIKSSLNDLSALVEEINHNSRIKNIIQRMREIKNNIKDISNNSEDASLQITNFYSSWKKTDYQKMVYNQQNRNENVLRFSAPPYSNYSRQSSLFSTTPKTRNDSNYSLNHRITSKPLHYSPIRPRETSNYHLESDDEDYDDIFQVNNYLLDNKFSPFMPNYS